VPPRRRTRSRSVVSNVIPALLADVLLARAGGDELVEGRVLALALAEDPAEALDVLADRAAPREDVRHGDVDPLVQHLRRDDGPEGVAVEPGEDRAPLLHLGLVGDRRDQEPPGD